MNRCACNEVLAQHAMKVKAKALFKSLKRAQAVSDSVKSFTLLHERKEKKENM